MKLDYFNSIKNAREKYDKCQSLSDSELKLLKDYYQNLSEWVRPLGPEFALFKREIHEENDRFDRMASFR